MGSYTPPSFAFKLFGSFYKTIRRKKANVFISLSSILFFYSKDTNIKKPKIQVALVCGLAQLFLVEMMFLNYQQTIYLYNFKKQKKHTPAVSFC